MCVQACLSSDLLSSTRLLAVGRWADVCHKKLWNSGATSRATHYDSKRPFKLPIPVGRWHSASALENKTVKNSNFTDITEYTSVINNVHLFL